MEEQIKTNPSEQQSSQIVTDSTKFSSKSKSIYYSIGIVILLLLVVGGGYLLLSKKSATQPIVTKQTIPNKPTSILRPTPVVSPVTSANVDQTLNNTDTAVQQVVTQVNSDLNSINNVDKSQDSTSGL